MSESLLFLSHVPVYENLYRIIDNIHMEMLSKGGGVKASIKRVKAEEPLESLVVGTDLESSSQ